jgi:hypothetical protein
MPILIQNAAREEPTFDKNSLIQDHSIEYVWSFSENINTDISTFDCL